MSEPSYTLKKSRFGQRGNQRIADVVSFLVLLVLAAFAMLPIWWIFRTSLMTNTEAVQYPSSQADGCSPTTRERCRPTISRCI